MSPLDTIIASLPGVPLALGTLLKTLHLEGRLEPLVREALAGQVVQNEARQLGLSVTTEELQEAATVFRRRRGLSAAADTHAWLAECGLSVGEFEAFLEGRLLAARLSQHLAGSPVEAHFTAYQPGYERLRLAEVHVGRDDLARELAAQVREGRDLEEVAREHGLSLARHQVLRNALVGPLAEALASAETGELIGPVVTPEGFALAVVEERRPAELDAATRQGIQDELFDGWLAAKLGEATLDQPIFGAKRHPAELDAATRQGIQDELFVGWPAGELGQATLDESIFG